MINFSKLIKRVFNMKWREKVFNLTLFNTVILNYGFIYNSFDVFCMKQVLTPHYIHVKAHSPLAKQRIFVLYYT